MTNSMRMGLPRGTSRRRFGGVVAGGLGVLATAGIFGACTGDQTVVEVRSLERTGRAAFLCLGEPGSPSALRPLSDCTAERYSRANNFGSDRSAAHLYALITLETRGELALIDLSASEGRILDQDPSTPGETSLPIGAQPTSVVTTPKSGAVFVSNAEIGRYGVYGISTEHLRPCEVDPARCDARPPVVSDWPGCRLTSAPGEMMWMSDPEVNGEVRSSCGGAYAPVDSTTPAFGDLDREGAGRQKLLITLPKEGRIVVVDAQELLGRAPGSFDDCIEERSVTLMSQPPLAPTPPAPNDPPYCAPPGDPAPRPVTRPDGTPFVSTPSGMTLGGDRIYIGDYTAPLVHVIDAKNPCDITELSTPLLPLSAEDPARLVYTSRLSAMPGITPNGKRYLYAIDVEDRSVMAFDISLDALASGPITLGNPQFNPSQPPDRVRFASAPNDLVLMQRDEPRSTGQGYSPFGVTCDPRPEAAVCSSTSTSCDLGTLYRTSSDYKDGAGPFQLRGTFALVALASGQIATIDVEDYDAACRGPQVPSPALGCAADASGPQITASEASCGVVIPHTPRSGVFMASNEDVGRNRPGLQSAPVLSLEDGTVITDGPRMRAINYGDLTLAVGADILDIDSGTGSADGHALNLNMEDPRVHQLDQEWTVTYQGSLPAFANQTADLRLSSTERALIEPSGTFCDGGVQSEAAIRERLMFEGMSGLELDAAARRMADRVHVSERLANIESPYWDSASCNYSLCRTTFGDDLSETAARDLRVLEAHQDKLTLAAPDGVSDELFECCFPTAVTYEVRPGDEWIVQGFNSGFLHNVIAAPSGECRPSCDPRLARRTSRVRSMPGIDVGEDPIVGPEDPNAYLGANFRFVIRVPQKDGVSTSKRDMTFRFTTQGSFVPLRGVLTNEDRPVVTPKAIQFLRQTDELVITDGGFEGVLFAPGDLNGSLRQFF